MHAALGVRQERTFEVDSDSASFAFAWLRFDCIGERFQCV